MDDKHDFCGICAASTPSKDCSYVLYQMMKDLQHRGQAGAGISTYDPERKIILRTYKSVGNVEEVFGGADNELFGKIMKRHTGRKGIGHTRYGTSGSLTSRHVQPFERIHGEKFKWFSFGFNGHIANRSDLEKQIRKMGYHLMLDTDTEVMLHLLSRHISDTGGDVKEVFSRMSEDLDGAYNISFINALGEMVVVRDPWGIRPLSSMTVGGEAFVASETCALHRYGTEGTRHIEPGEMAVMNEGSIEYHRFAQPRRKSLCFFEFLYFANVTSEIDGRSVYETRKRCGEELAAIEDQPINERDWVIIPVPNTARPIANSYAKALGLPQIYDEGLIAVSKGRTFIDEGDRTMKVRRKFLPIPSVVRGKKVVVIDDSIVRSTTMATLVKYHLKRIGGAEEVHIRIATPPIIAPCYYGIDMRSFEELIAAPYGCHINNGVLDREVEDGLGASMNGDSLRYMTHEGLLKALGLSRSEICMACLDRNYPTEWGRKLDTEAFHHFSDVDQCMK
ncbi:MAG: amidophosphoribosyltransferase [Thermoplasmatota archaeon]